MMSSPATRSVLWSLGVHVACIGGGLVLGGATRADTTRPTAHLRIDDWTRAVSEPIVEPPAEARRTVSEQPPVVELARTEIDDCRAFERSESTADPADSNAEPPSVTATAWLTSWKSTPEPAKTVSCPPPALPEARVLPTAIPGQCPPPDYPRRALRRRREGRVLLEVHVDAAGMVVACTMVQSSGHALLDRAAEEAVRRWRFAHGPGVVRVPIRFQLEDGATDSPTRCSHFREEKAATATGATSSRSADRPQ